MSKRFISFLGVSPYISCNYLLEDARVDQIRFVQTALLHLCAADYVSGDSILIGCTKKARETNLDALCAEVLASGWHGPALETVDLPDATSEQEMWEIFQTLMDRVEEGDELIFDITHSFRSLPLLFTVLIQYLIVVKRIRLRGVYYGAFERLGTGPQVTAMEPEERDAPIVDLTPFFSLYDWGAAIDHFLRFGYTGELRNLVANRINPVLKETRGQDHNASALRSIVSNLSDFVDSAQYARGKALSQIRFQTRISEPLRRVRGDFLPPLQPVLDALAERFCTWPDRDPTNGLRAVRWCIDHGMVQQGLTLLQETLVGVETARLSDLLSSVGSDLSDDKARLVRRRTFVSKLLNVLGQRKPAEEWQDELRQYRPLAEASAERLPPEMPAAYARLSQLRNDINHAGFVDAQSPEDLRGGLEESFRVVCDLIGIAVEDEQAPTGTPARTYFVSRHPGARDWAAQEGISVDEVIDHLDPTIIRPGDVLIGSLPVNLAAEVCERGGRYLHLSLDLPAELRGAELSAEQMRACGARIEEYRVSRSPARIA